MELAHSIRSWADTAETVETAALEDTADMAETVDTAAQTLPRAHT